jgi:hypothetical protein
MANRRSAAVSLLLSWSLAVAAAPAGSQAIPKWL